MTRPPRPAQPRIALVTPVYNEEDNIDRYVSEVRRLILDRTDIVAQVLFVDDGSNDSSWARIEEASLRDPRFRGVRLSRNFGAHAALSAGLFNLQPDTDAVAILACDLQDPPEAVNQFIERWRAGADIVWGERSARQDSRWRVMASHAFGMLLRRWAMPKGSLVTTGSFLLIDRKVVEAVRQMRERNRITFALVAWTGFDQERVQYVRSSRVAGRSGWTFGRMTKAMYDAFVGFSSVPITLMKSAATAAIGLAFGLVIYLLTVHLVHSTAPGWTSQMLLLAIFFGLQFSLMALMGEYLARLYGEAVRRPLYFVSETTAGTEELPELLARAETEVPVSQREGGPFAEDIGD